MDRNTDYRIKLFGYCSLGEESILEKFSREGPQGLRNLRGEYTIVIEKGDECCIITSLCGLCQYYYAVHENKFFHDDTVVGVLNKSCLPWSWNWRALADLTIIPLEHVLENDTLHPRVLRVPAASVVHFKEGVLNVSTPSWEELHPSFRAGPEAVLAAFNDEMEYWLSDDAVLSMSGGLDTRLMLSALLKNGCRPLLLSLGEPDSTDVSISLQIASALGLEFLPVSVDLEEYLQHGETITALTNGTLMAYHWHTYLYPKEAELDPSRPFFVGTGGEFAKRSYLDKGILMRITNMAPRSALRRCWDARMKSLFNESELMSLHPDFAAELTDDGNHARVERIIRLCDNRYLSGLDRFFSEQTMRNFLGNGVKVLLESVSWRSPFIGREWINAAWNLNQGWKFGSDWHRFAIENNYPQLLRFPHKSKTGVTYRRAPLFYWLRRRRSRPEVPILPYPAWFQREMIVDFLRENASLLSDLMEEATVIAIVEEHKKGGDRMRAMAFLISMIFWRKVLRDRCGG